MSDERLCLCCPVRGRQTREAPTWYSAERSPTELGKRSSRCCPNTAEAEANGGSTVPSSTASSGSLGPARPGVTFRRGTALGRDLLRSLQPLAARRYLGPLAGPLPDQKRCGGRSGVGSGVGSERGRHSDPGSPTRCGRQRRVKRGGRKKGLLNPEDEALGRRRGVFSIKAHLACDGKGRGHSPCCSLRLSATAARSLRNCSTRCGYRVREAHRAGPVSGPLTCSPTGATVFQSCRRLLRRRGIPHTIPERKDHKERRAGRPGRRPGFDREAYRRGNVVERCVNKLKQWRAIATRYEKRAVNYRAMVVIASLMMGLPS